MSAGRPVVIVLGAGMGGRAVAATLAQHAHVVVVDRTEELAQVAVDLVTAAGGTAEATAVNLVDLDEVTAFRDRVLAAHGRADAVIHLVGGWRGSKTVDAGAIAAWEALVPGVVTTLQTTSVVFRDALLAAPRGRYVMVSSTTADNPTAGNAGYASAKKAAETWVQALGHSFKDSDARAVVLAVKALLDDDMRAASPGKSFAGFTDTRDLAATIRDLLTDGAVINGARVLAPTVPA